MSKNVQNKMWEKLNQTLLIEKWTLGMNKYLTHTQKCSQAQEKMFKDVHSRNLRAERFTDREDERPRGASDPGQGV